MNPTRDEILASFPLFEVMEQEGLVLIGTGSKRKALCCFHLEKSPSISADGDKGLWWCFGCNKGGSVIDFLALKQGKAPEDILRELSAKVRPNVTKFKPQAGADGEVVATYVYRNALGEDSYRVLRYKPKNFRQQRRLPGVDAWAWGMEGVERVLYRLPEILAAKPEEPIWITAGEKDVATLVAMGFNATTNAGGEGNWAEGYVQWLAGRDVILCGDNDEAGKKFVAKVTETLDGKVKRLRIVRIPDPDKDVSDYRARFGSNDACQASMLELLVRAAVMVAGASVPILSMAEMEDRYLETLTLSATRTYSFKSWLPTFGQNIRPSVPGDVICFAAPTGAGKTCLLQNMAWRAAPLPVLLFEMELSDTICFERFVASAMAQTQDDVEGQYRGEYRPDWRETGRLDAVYICPISGLTVTAMESIINRAELKMGVRPALVMVDYAQLVRGTGKSRYEQQTSVMTDIKSMAKNTGTVLVVASQVGRRTKGDDNPTIGLEAGKDSGQLENSSALHIGVWRETGDVDNTIVMQVNKNTRGRAGLRIKCDWDGPRMLITERPKKMPDFAA